MVTLEKMSVRYQVKFGHWIPRLLRRGAWTFFGTIHVADKLVLPADLHAHEFMHIYQQMLYGQFGFACRYLWQLATKGYKKIDFEVTAYEYQNNPEWVSQFAPVVNR